MDELRRVRELAKGVPDPDPHRKASARAELLEMAEAEETAAVTDRALSRPGPVERLRARWRGRLRPVAAAGLAAVVLTAAMGVTMLLSGVGSEPSPEIAGPEPQEETAPQGGPTDGESPSDTRIEFAASCRDPEGRVTISYPDDWSTPESGEPGACRLFGEEDFEVDAAVGGAPLADVEVAIEPMPFDEVAEGGVSYDERDREPLEIGERRALRQRLEVTGEGALPEGMLVERILIDLDGESVRLSTHADDEDVLDERRPLLEGMAQDLEVHPAR